MRTIAGSKLLTISYLFGIFLCAGTVFAQTGAQNPAAEGGTQRNGFALRNLTFGSMYYSGLSGSELAGLQLRGDNSATTLLQGSATFGWVHKGLRSRFSLAYTPQYVYGIGSFRSLNHSLGISGSRSIGTRWSIDMGASGLLNDFNQLLFSPSRLANIAGTNSSFDELAAALLTGRTGNWELFDATRMSSLADSAERAFLYGGRMLSATGSVGASYAHSTRSSIRVSAIALTTQFTSRGSNGSERPEGILPPLLTRTSAANLTLSWAYSLSPRSSLTLDGSGSRVQSPLQDAYTTRGGVSIGRTLTPRWFVQATAGAGVIRPLRQTVATVRGLQQELGGSIGYKRLSNTFVGSFNRAVSDTYGIGANATRTATAGWRWSRPGSPMTASASFGYSQLIGPSFPNSGSWLTNASVARLLQRTVSLQFTFNYAQFPRAILLAAPSLSQTAAIASLVWSPQATHLTH